MERNNHLIIFFDVWSFNVLKKHNYFFGNEDQKKMMKPKGFRQIVYIFVYITRIGPSYGRDLTLKIVRQL